MCSRSVRCLPGRVVGKQTWMRSTAWALPQGFRPKGSGYAAAAAGINRAISSSTPWCNEDISRLSLFHQTNDRLSTNGQPGANDGSSTESNSPVLSAQAPVLKLPNKLRPTESWTFQQYVYQSSVNVPATGETRLVDSPEHRDDYTLWLDLLLFQERINGRPGVWMIFEGMRSRRIDLPVEGPEAKHLWKAVVTAALHRGTIEDLWEYVRDLYKRSSRRYEGLYEIFVGYYLARGNASLSPLKQRPVRVPPPDPASYFELAYLWHSKLRKIDLPSPGALKRLIPFVVEEDAALETFMGIYLACDERNLYDIIIPALCKHRKYEQAVRWHRFLIDNGDAPTTAPADSQGALALLSHIRDRDSSKASVLSMQPERGTTPKLGRQIRREMDVGERQLSDEFCARAFATKAFSPSLVIKGLAAFGLKSIGPLSVQALALRCRTLVETYSTGSSDPVAVADELAVQLHNLKSSGIHLRECKYSLFVQKVALERDGKLLDATISSDQHPDVYEDRVLQTKLFESYVHYGDITQAYKTLKFLTFNSSNAMWASWNALIRACFKSSDNEKWSKISHVFEAMLAKKVSFSRSTVRSSLHTLLGTRNPWKAPVQVTTTIDSLSFVANMWIQSMRLNNGAIDPELWKELHLRFGLLKRFDQLESSILWTGLRYSTKTGSSGLATLMRRSTDAGVIRTLPSGRNFRDNRLDRLVPPSRQKEIIAWYFETLAQREREPQDVVEDAEDTLLRSRSVFADVEKWARGVAIIQKLKSFGLTVDTRTVRRECRTQLIRLFANNLEFFIKRRRERTQNKRSLRYMVTYLQNLWLPVGSLFIIPEGILADTSEEGEQYLRDMILNQPLEMHELYESQDFPQVGRDDVRWDDLLLPATLPTLEKRLDGFRVSMVYKIDPNKAAKETVELLQKQCSPESEIHDEGKAEERGSSISTSAHS